MIILCLFHLQKLFYYLNKNKILRKKGLIIFK